MMQELAIVETLANDLERTGAPVLGFDLSRAKRIADLGGPWCSPPRLPAKL